MRFFATADADSETGVGQSVLKFSAIAEFWFKDKNYGVGLDGACVVVTCRDPDLKLKQRIRLATNKADPKSFAPFPRKPGGRYFDMDLMLDYNEFVKERKVQQYSYQVSAKLFHTDAEREQLIRRRIVQEVPAVLRKYVTRRKDPLKDFDLDRFERDLRKCLLEGGVEEITPEYNRHAEKALQGYTPPKDWRS